MRNCPTKGNIYLDEISDSNNPKCASNCSGNYIDSLTISGVKRCVSSCKNLEPTAYIYTDTENNDKLTCIRECPADNIVDYTTDPNNPKCVTACPENHYIDAISSDLKVCVPSCNDLIPPAIITNDKKECIRVCPNGQYADYYTDAENP